MALEYKLSYTAEEIDAKLGLVGQNKDNIDVANENIEALVESVNVINGTIDTINGNVEELGTSVANKADKDHTHDYAEENHTHDNYAEVGHVHDYAEINHEHTNYANVDHDHFDKYDELGAANVALGESKTYTDNAVKAVKDDLLNGAGEAYDTLKELGDLIDNNVDAIEALELVASSKADADHTHPGLEVVSEEEPTNQSVGDCWVQVYGE